MCSLLTLMNGTRFRNAHQALNGSKSVTTRSGWNGLYTWLKSCLLARRPCGNCQRFFQTVATGADIALAVVERQAEDLPRPLAETFAQIEQRPVRRGKDHIVSGVEQSLADEMRPARMPEALTRHRIDNPGHPVLLLLGRQTANQSGAVYHISRARQPQKQRAVSQAHSPWIPCAARCHAASRSQPKFRPQSGEQQSSGQGRPTRLCPPAGRTLSRRFDESFCGFRSRRCNSRGRASVKSTSTESRRSASLGIAPMKLGTSERKPPSGTSGCVGHETEFVQRIKVRIAVGPSEIECHGLRGPTHVP